MRRVVSRLNESPPADSALAWALAGLLLVVYHFALLPSWPGLADSAKFQLLAAVPGTPHPSGYPTWVLLAGLARSVVPWASPVYAADLLTALFSVAGTVGVFYLLRTLGSGRFASFAGAFAMGLTASHWSQSVTAEVYSLHYLFVVAVLLALLRWRERGDETLLALALGLLVLTFTNHLASICLLPAVAAFLLVTEPRAMLRPRVLAALALAGLAALALYFRIVVVTYSTHAAHLEIQALDLRDLLGQLAHDPHRNHFFTFDGSALLRERLPLVAGAVARELGPLLLLLPLACRWRRPAPATLLLGVFGAAVFLFVLGFTIAEHGILAIPLVMVLLVFAVRGLERLLSGLPARFAWMAPVLLAAVPLGLLVVNFPTIERQQRNLALEGARLDHVLARLARGAVLVSDRYELSMGLLQRTSLPGSPVAGVKVMHVPPVAFSVPVAMAPLERYAAGEPLRHGVAGAFLPSGLPIYCLCTAAEPLTARGWRLQPLARGLIRMELAAPSPALPAAFLVEEVTAVADVPAAIARLRDPAFDGQRQAIVLGTPVPAARHAADSSAPRFELRVLRRDEGSIELEAELDRPGWLVLAESFSARWQGRVNGVRVPRREVDLSYPGLPLPAGRPRILWAAEPAPAELSAWLWRGPVDSRP